MIKITRPEDGYLIKYPSDSTPDQQLRKTWSAPNKDPFGAEELQREINQRQFVRGDKLEDPLQRNKGQAGQSYSSGYEPSFGARARRGGAYAAAPVSEREKYLQELEEQMKEKKMRKEKEKAEAVTDWWEKKKPADNYYRMPHPSQV